MRKTIYSAVAPDTSILFFFFSQRPQTGDQSASSRPGSRAGFSRRPRASTSNPSSSASSSRAQKELRQESELYYSRDFQINARNFSRKPSGSFWVSSNVDLVKNAAGVSLSSESDVQKNTRFLSTLARASPDPCTTPGNPPPRTAGFQAWHRQPPGAADTPLGTFYEYLRRTPPVPPLDQSTRPSKFYETLRQSKIFLN